MHMNKSKTEKIILKNNMVVNRTTINYKRLQNGTEIIEKIRWYIPDWNEMIHSQLFYDQLKIQLHLSELNINIYKMLFLFYLIYAAELRKENGEIFKRKDKVSAKRNRKLDMNSLLYNDIFNYKFNPTLFHQDDISEKDRTKYIFELKEQLSKNKNNDENILKLLNNAIYEEEFSSNMTKIGYLSFYVSKFEKLADLVSKHFTKKDNLNFEDYLLIKNELEEDKVLNYIKDSNFIKILNSIETIQNEIDFKEIENRRRRIYKKGSDDQLIGYDLIKINKIYSKLKDHLIGKKKKSRNNDNKENINILINKIEEYQSGNEEYQLDGLLFIKDTFADKSSALRLFMGEIEEQLRFCIQTYSKNLFNQLVKEENLTKAEKRLYIYHNIGIKEFYYRIPLFDKALIQFFNYDKKLVPIFIEAVLLGIKEVNGIDLKNYLFNEFKKFLRFYSLWHKMVKESDKYTKKDERYNRRKNEWYNKENDEKKNYLDEISDSDLIEKPYLDYQSNSENIAFNEDEKEFEEATDREYEQENFGKINKANTYKKSKSSDSLTDLFDVKTLLRQNLSNDELFLYELIILKDNNEKEIAENLNISQSLVSRKKTKLFEKIKGIDGIEDFLK